MDESFPGVQRSPAGPGYSNSSGDRLKSLLEETVEEEASTDM